jgi:hypothetical protein
MLYRTGYPSWISGLTSVFGGVYMLYRTGYPSWISGLTSVFGWVYMLYRTGYPSWISGLTSVFGWVYMLFIFLVFCVVFLFCFLRPVSCVPTVASLSGLSNFDCPFGFL